MNEITALAAQRGVELRKLKLIQNNFYTMKGSMPKRTMVGGAEPIDLEVEVDCDLDDAALNSLLMDAVHASPLNGLMRGQLDSLFKLARNGTELPTAKATELNGPIFPDPGNHFATAKPAGTLSDLVGAVGPTLKKEVPQGTSAAAGSLADEQNRRLNIGAIAVLREDGIKDL